MVGKILIVDDVSTNRIVFKVKLTAASYQPLLAADGATCLQIARDKQPDLILLDLMLPDMSGTDVLRRLRADPATRRIPVVMFSANSDAAQRMAALQAGADDFLTKPIDDQTLLARLRSFMRARDYVGGLEPADGGLTLLGLAEAAAPFEMPGLVAPGLVALVTNRPETALQLRKELAAHSLDRLVIRGLDDVFHDGDNAATTPDVYVIEADAGGPGGGLRLMSELRSRQTSRFAAFCILNRETGQGNAAMAFDLGANDQVNAPVNPAEMALRLRTLLRRKRDGDRARASVQDGLRLAIIDPLTGLHNRRYGIAQLGAIADRAQGDGSSFAVMVADLDRFKSVNDKWGHAAGDAVLIEVAARLGANLRGADLLARIGGEEFLIALPATPLAEAREVAERLCHTVEQTPITLPGGAQVSVTISIGLAISDDASGQTDRPCPSGLHPSTVTGPARTAQMIDRADHALLAAKTGGRNQVTISRNAA